MKRAALLLVLLAACRNQEKVCQKAFGEGWTLYVPNSLEYQKRCIAEQWSDSKIECMQHTGDRMRGLYCSPEDRP